MFGEAWLFSWSNARLQWQIVCRDPEESAQERKARFRRSFPLKETRNTKTSTCYHRIRMRSRSSSAIQAFIYTPDQLIMRSLPYLRVWAAGCLRSRTPRCKFMLILPSCWYLNHSQYNRNWCLILVNLFLYIGKHPSGSGTKFSSSHTTMYAQRPHIIKDTNGMAVVGMPHHRPYSNGLRVFVSAMHVRYLYTSLDIATGWPPPQKHEYIYACNLDPVLVPSGCDFWLCTALLVPGAPGPWPRPPGPRLLNLL